MINNKLIFLLTLFMLLFFSYSSYGAKPIRIYWENGSLMNETHYNGEKLGQVESCPDKMFFVLKCFVKFVHILKSIYTSPKGKSY